MQDSRVLVVHAGRYGSTAEVAEVVAEELRRCGVSVDASPATEGLPLDAYTVLPDEMRRALGCGDRLMAAPISSLLS